MIQFTNIVRNADQSWTFTWTADGTTTYRVVLLGSLLGTTLAGTYTVSGTQWPKIPPPLEVTTGVLAQTELYPSYVLIQWYHEAGISAYQVQVLVAGVWQTLQTIPDTGNWLYTYNTRELPDDTAYSYRVIAIDVLGNLSSPTAYSGSMIRVPDTTDGTLVFAYSAGTLTIGAV